MANIRIVPEVIGKKLYRLNIYLDGQRIGEYERSQAADIDRKTREIELAIGTLESVFDHHGEFTVRWNRVQKKKSIRVDGVEVATIPRSCWQKPSWK